jgi:hypothetical protein
MKAFSIFAVAAGFCCVVIPCQLPGADEKTTFEGTISATFARSGTQPIQFLFTCKGERIRIEDVDKSKPEPINVVDLNAKKLTIIYPHNSTYVRIDTMKTPGAPGALPPGVPGSASVPVPPQPGAHPPAISPPPGFPTVPPMPPNPANAGLPGGANLPQMPVMPAAPASPRSGGEMELKKTDQTRTIHGYASTCYNATNRLQTIEIWATADSALFPFRLLQRNASNRRFGPPMIEEEWAALLQKHSLFPLEAIMRDQGGNEQLSFQVTKVEARPVDDAGGALFSAPEGFVETLAPPF